MLRIQVLAEASEEVQVRIDLLVVEVLHPSYDVDLFVFVGDQIQVLKRLAPLEKLVVEGHSSLKGVQQVHDGLLWVLGLLFLWSQWRFWGIFC